MISSQSFIPIENVNQDLIFLKDGGVAILLSVSAVNFALLFETEQISIIDSFAGLINSLSFPIQIVIYSRVLDVSSYLHTIDSALAKQNNPLLKKMTLGYRSFVEKSIKDNNVLDKRFYICIKITALEIGLLPSNLEERIRKATTLLSPRKDHLIKQLNRLGLKTKQLTTEEIIKLFYELYNPQETLVPNAVKIPAPPTEVTIIPQKLRPIKANLNPPIPKITVQPVPPTPTPPPQPKTEPATVNMAPSQTPLASPFIVEELPDDGS